METFFKLLPYLIPVGLVSFGFIKYIISMKKNNQLILDEKKEIIVNLRSQILELVELEGKRKDVEEKKTTIKTNITDISSDDLESNYSDKLSNRPRRK